MTIKFLKCKVSLCLKTVTFLISVLGLSILPLGKVNAQGHKIFENTNWARYIDLSLSSAVTNYLFLDAYDKYTADIPPGIAVDFGSGAGNETIFLAKKGWTVYAYDSEKRSGEVLQARSQDLKGEVIFQLSDFDSAILPSDINLFMSFYALPFGKKESLPHMITNLSVHMQKDGIFIAQFFGEEGSYVKSKECYGMNESEIRNLLQENNFKIQYFLRRTFMKVDGANKGTIFDVFDVIAKKQ